MRTMTSALALAALMALAAPTDGVAQRGPRGDRGPGMRQGGGVEMVMRMRSQLELTDDQVERLDAIRQESVERRAAHQAEMAELRSQVVAGERTRDELREVAAARRQAAQAMRDAQRERVESVLTEDQLQQVQVMRARAEGFRRGRADEGRGQRSQRGACDGRRPLGPGGPGGPGR